ncbi:MAG: hypothetical protein RLY20_1539 [Verrucomicrobiota bacterium]|jgi:DnaJ-domain-containing protein 1
MTDYFALLGQPRRPWLDEEPLKNQFHKLSSLVHPDRNHGLDEAGRKAANDRYAELNAAYQCLRQPKMRLAHLLLLERGAKPGDLRNIPDEIANLFGEVGQLLRTSGIIADEKSRAVSAIQKAGALARALPVIETISTLQAEIRRQRCVIDDGLRTLDSRWTAERQDPTTHKTLFADMEQLYHHLGFLERWASQLQEREIQLTL